jgi:aminoglycoside phosphotransferase (APT) family kinase protein
VPYYVKRRAAPPPGSIAGAGPLTLVHGDAQTRNMRTGPGEQVALLDWEDVSAAPGALDLAWLLTASTDPERWDEVTAAYGAAEVGMDTGTGAMTGALARVLPAVMVQGFLSMADEPTGSPGALAWTGRLDEALRRLG